jgi:hypothetical protein
MTDFQRNYKPVIVYAKFDGVCAETKKKIQRGDKCIYDPLERKIYHMDSPSAMEYMNSFPVNGVGARRKTRGWKRFKPSFAIAETKNLSSLHWLKIFREQTSIPWKWQELTIG